jgi:prolyl-tRNA editing enzyme YbaK/EbsC (Cys-tRNA(Pro) deacylase)
MSAHLALDELRCAWHLAQQVGSSPEGSARSKPATASTPVATPTPVPSSDVAEDDRTHKAVLALLRENGASFDTLTHAPTRTSEESAKVRGVPLASGSKAMLLKAGKPLAHGSPYVLAVMSAVRTVDWPKIRKLVDSSKLSMASIDDVAALTGCLPGAVPPFGSLFPGGCGDSVQWHRRGGHDIAQVCAWWQGQAGLALRSFLSLDFALLPAPPVYRCANVRGQVTGRARP